MLNLYILFQPTRSAEESPVAKQPIPIELSDELQFRCAGFIQAEIERYVDLLDEERGEDGEDGSDDGSSSGLSDEDGTKIKKSKKGKKVEKKKVERAGSAGTSFQPGLR